MVARPARRARSRKASRNQPATARGEGSKRPRRRWRRWILGLLVIPALLLGAIGLLAFYLIFSSVPLPDDIEARSSLVFDSAGEEVGGLSADAAREDIEATDLPDHVRDAVLAAEDRDFYDHRGISFTGIARALFTNVRSGSIRGGGSTITQQYIKNAALTPEQTYRRKVEEAALAIKLEQAYEKDEILTFYLNTAYWGRGTNGIETAAQTYFGIPAAELSLNQAATLAGLLPAPEAYDPLVNADRAEARRQYVLGGMLEEGWISQDEHDTTVALGLPDVADRGSVERGPNAYYIDAVRRELAAQPQFAQGELFRGLRIFTELDQSLQQAAQETLTAAIADGPTDSGAIVSIDPVDGAIRSLVGGPDIGAQPFNTAVRSTRQVGSIFKVFTLQAFLEAERTPDERFPAPAEIEIDDAQEPIRNYGGASFGEQSVRQATASSTNTVYVRMQEDVGREAVIDAAVRAGLPADKEDEVFPSERGEGPSMAPLAGLTLGQDGFSPVEMTSAYATYAAGGHATRPRMVVRVEDEDGRIIYEPERDDEQRVDLEVARGVTDVLAEVVSSGSGSSAALDDRPVAGKTGTTNEGRDVWFTGYVPQLATTVWLGNLENDPIDTESATGGALAAPVWRDYMTRAVADLPVEEFTPPGDGEDTTEQTASCPGGYQFADPPSAVDEDGFFPDVLVDITDGSGRPCVEIKPTLPSCPSGYAYGAPPSGPDEFGRTPDVLDEPHDFQGRPCVEILEPIEEPETSEEPEAPADPEQSEEPGTAEQPSAPADPEQPQDSEEPEDPGTPEDPDDPEEPEAEPQDPPDPTGGDEPDDPDDPGTPAAEVGNADTDG